jgi:nucleoside-diphosphate-sugar epimerase
MGSDAAGEFVLTGATGFLGSHLMASLVKRGDRVVVLGRPSERSSLELRIAQLLQWFGVQCRSGQVETAEADLLKPRLGLEPERYAELCSRGSQVVHLASDTRFSRVHLAQSMDTNVRSLKQIIAFAKESQAPFFHYVSTAYVVGDRCTPCPEEPVRMGGFANIYEETKARAEAEVAARCGESGIAFTILRPSIVYGDSRSGRSNSFTALYHHVKALILIRDIYLSDIRNHGGEKSRALGIRLDAEGILHLPLKIFLPRRGFVNLIPIDYFVSAALNVIEHAQPGCVYHLTSDAPSTMEELASYCERFLKMKGIEVVYHAPPDGFKPNPPEALFNKLIEPYRPYLSDTREFERRNLDCAGSGELPPRLSFEIFERCMEYAVSVNWGSEAQRNGSGLPVR